MTSDIKTDIPLLLVEDNPVDALILEKMLSHSDQMHFKISIAGTLEKAIQLLRENTFEICLLDLVLPDSEGMATFLRLNEEFPACPVVIMTGLNDVNLALEAVRKGAQDYIIKGTIDDKFLLRILIYAIERYKMQQQMASLSMIDKLTGLYNRHGFMILADQQFKISQRKKTGFYLFYADLDYLKIINDTYGHPEGDFALQGVAEVLKLTFRKSDIISRVGGDEFIVVLIEALPDSGPIFVERLAHHIKDLNRRVKKPYTISLSIGMAFYDPAQSTNLEMLIQEADQNLLLQKRQRSLEKKT